jgi:hypothetical protein
VFDDLKFDCHHADRCSCDRQRDDDRCLGAPQRALLNFKVPTQPVAELGMLFSIGGILLRGLARSCDARRDKLQHDGTDKPAHDEQQITRLAATEKAPNPHHEPRGKGYQRCVDPGVQTAGARRLGFRSVGLSTTFHPSAFCPRPPPQKKSTRLGALMSQTAEMQM